MDFLTDWGVVIALVCSGAAVAYGVLTSRWLLALSPGNDEMQRISRAVQEGASAYLRRQYTIIGGVAVVLAVVLAVALEAEGSNGHPGGHRLPDRRHLLGRGRLHRHERVGAGQRPGGRVGAQRRVEGTRGGLQGRRRDRPARGRPGAARRGRLLRDPDPGRHERARRVDALVGLGFGGSLISVFARLGGGIFTKAADVGADLVGKIEAGIPEDDPRNPAVIADNVGDNVGDCAGMAADLFETYAVTAVAVMLLGILTFNETGTRGRLPADHRRRVAASRRSSAPSPCAARAGNVERALYQGLIVSGGLAAIAFLPDHADPDGRHQLQGRRVRPAAARALGPDRRSTSGSARWSASASPPACS